MFGGLLASAIATMDGIRNQSSWRWIFILEGIATILIGIGAFFAVPDFPEDSPWLSSDEKALLAARSAAAEPDADAVTMRKVLRFFQRPENFLAGILYFGMSLITPMLHSDT